MTALADIFRRADIIEAAGLEVPATVRMAELLRQRGVIVPEDKIGRAHV